MLVLTRKRDQQIQIGGGVTVTVVRVKGSSVQLGIDAPREVHVVRGELAGRDRPGTPETLTRSPGQSPGRLPRRCGPTRRAKWPTGA